jgi:PAS domain S-box-containing protein
LTRQAKKRNLANATVNLKTILDSKTEIETEITERKKAEDALRASEEKYRYLIKYAPTGIYEIDFTGPRFDTVNDAMCEMSGYTREELLVKNPFDLLTPESQIQFKQRIGKALAGEKPPENVEYKVITKSGQELWATLHMKFISRNGRFCGSQVVAHDISDRKKAEEALRVREESYRFLLENAPIAIYEIDFKGQRFKSFNEGLCMLSGYSREELLTKNKSSPLSFLGKKIFGRKNVG